MTFLGQKSVKNGQLYYFLDVRKSYERQASNKFYKICSENSRFQVVFRTDIFQKVTLGAPEILIGRITVPQKALNLILLQTVSWTLNKDLALNNWYIHNQNAKYY